MRSTASPHIVELDGLRGIAVSLVMMQHLWKWHPEASWARPVLLVTQLGWTGVDLFFVLSGFLITGILCESKPREDYLRRFFMRRSLRIVPVYFVTLAILFALVRPVAAHLHTTIAEPAGPAWSHFAYVSNFAIARVGAIRWLPADISWSLAIEQQFYLLWPFAVRALTARQLGWLAAVMFVAAIPARVLAFEAMGATAAYVLPFCRMDSLAIGALVALALRADRMDRLAPLLRFAPLTWGLFALSVALGGFEPDTLFCVSVGYSLIAVLGATCLVAALHTRNGRWRALLRTRALVKLGELSYALYLFHATIDAVLRKTPGLRELFAHAPTSFPVAVAAAVGAAVLSLLAASLSARYLERPLLRWKDRIAG